VSELAMIEDDILSAEFVFSTQDILAEYQRLCEEAAETHSLDVADNSFDHSGNPYTDETY
jgi:hypothetical protein